jgi:hypothetical protein
MSTTPRALMALAILLSFGASAQNAKVEPAPDGDPFSVSTKAIRKAEHPCGKVISAQRRRDGSVLAMCANGEWYLVATAVHAGKKSVFALKCSAAERLGVHAC